MSIHAQSMHTFDQNIAISYHDKRHYEFNNRLEFIDKIMNESSIQVLEILVDLVFNNLSMAFYNFEV